MEIDYVKFQIESISVPIKDNEGGKSSDPVVLLESTAFSSFIPYLCEPSRASFALMAAFYMEMHPRDYFDEAEKYFVMATQLSDRPFYKEMLDNFKKRQR